MKTRVLLEKLPNNHFRATGLGEFALSVEGTIRAEALNNFEKAAIALLPQNAEVVTIDLPIPDSDKNGAEHSWAWFAGHAKEDSFWERYLEKIELNRREDDENEARKVAEEENLP